MEPLKNHEKEEIHHIHSFSIDIHFPSFILQLFWHLVIFTPTWEAAGPSAPHFCRRIKGLRLEDRWDWRSSALLEVRNIQKPFKRIQTLQMKSETWRTLENMREPRTIKNRLLYGLRKLPRINAQPACTLSHGSASGILVKLRARTR